MKIDNVTVSIQIQGSNYTKSSEGAPAAMFILSASVTSNSRAFLERVAQAIHLELANPEKEPMYAEVQLPLAMEDSL